MKGAPGELLAHSSGAGEAALRKHRKKTSTEILHQAKIFRSFQKRLDAIDRKLRVILSALRGRDSRDR
jgi:hypothetical protein